MIETVTPLIDTMINFPAIPLGGCLLLLLIYTLYLHLKIHRFTRGSSGASLEEVMRACVDGISNIEKRNELISKHALLLEERVSHTVRNAHTVRYKAFDTNSSNQSFSVALINEKGNGVVLSSLHAHDRTSIFAKPIENYGSAYELTDEEKLAIEESKTAHKKTLRVKDTEE